MKAKTNRNGRRLILLVAGILSLIVLIQGVNAIGISPGRTTIDFTPNLHKEVQFKIINNEHKDMKVLLYVEGELNNSITLYNRIIDFAASEESKIFKYDADLPASIGKPGEHEVKIIAMELPKESGEGKFVGATAAVATQLLVRVPYPYKYAEIELSVVESEVNGTAAFYVGVSNLGQHDLVDTSANIEIFNSANERIAIVKTNKKTINAMTRTELVASWNANVNAGKYRAVASLVYDDNKIATAEKIFAVGTLMMDVVDINVKNFRLGDIAKFDVTVENKWGDVIKDVFAQLQILDERGSTIANTKSATADVPALGRQVLVAYWDTAGIKEGTYSGKLILNYADKTLEKMLKTDIKLNSIKVEIVGASITAKATAAEGGRQNLMFILIIILIVVNIAWFVYFKRREKR